jgi:hypothetical protein
VRESRLRAPDKSQSVRHRRASTLVDAASFNGAKERMWHSRSSGRSERQTAGIVAVGSREAAACSPSRRSKCFSSRRELRLLVGWIQGSKSRPCKPSYELNKIDRLASTPLLQLSSTRTTYDLLREHSRDSVLAYAVRSWMFIPGQPHGRLAGGVKNSQQASPAGRGSFFRREGRRSYQAGPGGSHTCCWRPG